MPSNEQPSGAENLEVLDDLLRGEISAVETYQQALQRERDKILPEAAAVRTMQLEHANAIQALRKLLMGQGAKPVAHSGAWGAWARTVQGTAGLLGRNATLKSLKEGEEHGLKEYERALRKEGLPAEGRSLIQRTLMPQTASHIARLDQLLRAV